MDEKMTPKEKAEAMKKYLQENEITRYQLRDLLQCKQITDCEYHTMLRNTDEAFNQFRETLSSK